MLPSGLVKGVAQAPNIALEDIDVMFQTNVTGLITMTQAILPIFKARPDGGRGDIINIGSIAGREPYQGGSIYCATKAAVRSFTDALRRELIATRIRVIEIDPGQVETEFSVVRFYGDKDKAKAVYAGVEPLTPDDIAEVVVFTAARRENVVIADTLIFPNHQVSVFFFFFAFSVVVGGGLPTGPEQLLILVQGGGNGDASQVVAGSGLGSTDGHECRLGRAVPCTGSLLPARQREGYRRRPRGIARVCIPCRYMDQGCRAEEIRLAYPPRLYFTHASHRITSRINSPNDEVHNPFIPHMQNLIIHRLPTSIHGGGIIIYFFPGMASPLPFFRRYSASSSSSA